MLNENIIIDHFENSNGVSIPSTEGANIIFTPPNGNMELTDNLGANSFDNEMHIFFRHNTTRFLLLQLLY